MAHFAKLDENNIVETVVVIDNSVCLDGDGNESEAVGVAWCVDFFDGGTWKQTSFNTQGNVHNLEGTPFRKNYATIGMTYDATKDAFIPIKPYASWTLNSTTCIWEAPYPHPSDGTICHWDESLHQSDNTKGWVED